MEKISLVQLLGESAKAALAAQCFTLATLYQGSPKKTASSPKKNDASGDKKETTEEGSQNDDDDDDDDTGFAGMGNVAASFEIKEKPTLSTKAGAAATDLVTEADLATQAIIVHHLRSVFGDGLCIVGEEDEDECKVPAENVPELNTMQPIHGEKYLGHAAVEATTSDILTPPISQVKVFIDPIDGTGAFVQGVMDVPMTLVGITVNGVPVGGIANRVFIQDHTSLSYCMKNWCCVLWGKDRTTVAAAGSGNAVETGADVTPTSKVDCTYSGSVKPELINGTLAKLEPIERKPERGAGYKLMLCCAPGYDWGVFVAGSVKKWDTCAPEAFMRYCGGGVICMDKDSLATGSPVELNYDAMVEEKQQEGSKPSAGAVVDTSLPKDLLACRTKAHLRLAVDRLTSK